MGFAQPNCPVNIGAGYPGIIRAFGVSPMVPLVILPLVPLAAIGCHWYHWQSENSERISVAICNFLLVVNNESRSSFSTTPL